MAVKKNAKAAEKTQKAAQEPFGVFVSDLDQYLFGHGVHYDIFRKLGAHRTVKDGVEGIYFAVWAPHAAAVHVIGSFNGWNEESHAMTRLEPLGIFELFTPDAKIGDMYKFLIYTADSRKLYKADPFANFAEKRPGTASIVTDITTIKWSDSAWMKKQQEFKPDESPIAIYEVHPGSWMRHPHGEDEDGYYNYREFGTRCVEYVKKMGYTHVELMGIAEHPFDGSWGYQVTGYYAPTSRYGTPEDFAWMVNNFHKNNIGVILDWVPAHFPRDAHGLADFDGQPCFEYADPRKGEHPDWGTKVFDFSKSEVKNFLIGNALYWVEQFHVDGLRVDAVASMLYLDYGKKPGQWTPNREGGNANLEAVEFLRHVNSIMAQRNPHVMMIAEESTAWAGVTAPTKDGGLGFTFKWNMGFMHDFLEYLSNDPLFRKYHHNQMTFSLTYAASENFILVLSHDEVVHLKKSMLEKIPGYDEHKFPSLMAGYAYYMGHPGKKLLFMGQDFGQRREWSEERELDWFLLQQPPHQRLQAFFRDLLTLYRTHDALYADDHGFPSFEWINADDAYRSIFSFVRKAPNGKGNLLFVINFTPIEHKDYRVGVPTAGNYRLLLSESEDYATCRKKHRTYKAKKSPCDNREWSIGFDLKSYGIAILQFDY